MTVKFLYYIHVFKLDMTFISIGLNFFTTVYVAFLDAGICLHYIQFQEGNKIKNFVIIILQVTCAYMVRQYLQSGARVTQTTSS